MTQQRVEIAAHVPRTGLTAVRLFGGPWDGQDVWVSDTQARWVQVNGPRHGDHTVWITHLYEWRGERYEFVATEVTPLWEGWP
jgi:hypothetical protein